MSKLIGTGPNQVPSNADLGTAAFMDATDFLTSRGSSLSAVNAVIPKTAVDVFVYDTSQDSDGGAWRKRTKNTSWYNEPLNTTTRGSRREFPAVAVIILTNTNVVIYDGDDPTLPMWMEFNIYYSNYSQGSGILGGVYGGANQNNTATGITMMNGQMWMTRLGAYNGTANYGAAVFVDFLQDLGGALGDAFGNGVTVKNPTFLGNIAQRNSSAFSGHGQYKYWSDGIVNDQCNDVAMTVLPNAPIDTDTGLPVPTIAAATNGGVSVIKDDGTVVDITHTVSTNNNADKIDIVGQRLIYSTQQSGSSTNYWRLKFIDIPSADTTGSYASNLPGYQFDARGTTGFAPALNTDADLNDTHNNIIDFAADKAVGFTNKLTLLQDAASISGVSVSSVYEDAAVAYITSDYNTGWMNGDIQLATLSDTDTTNATDANIVTITSFTAGTGGSVSTSGTQLTITQTSGSNGRAVSPTFSTELGKKYMFTAEGVSSSGGAGFRAEVRGPEIVNNLFTGTSYITFDGTGGGIYVELYCMSGVGGSVTYDNILVQEIESDRSVNGGAGVGANGLQVFGTVTKDPVATGADLVGYSGFATSSYLFQPFNSDLAFGNGEYFATIWFKDGGTNEMLINVASDGTNQIWGIRIHTNNKLLAQVTDDGFASRSIINTGPEVNSQGWQMASITRLTNGVINLYLNGELLGSGSAVEANLTDPARVLIGVENSSGNKPFSGSLALARISATVPSAEQIKKIYEDEKFLFQENAKATLYGSSDAVTALAYDNITETLHVGTSDGRSDFQGLRRVNNTTRAVGAAISVVDGFIVEE